MNELLIKGYAERSDMSPLGKTWYIPHLGVHHPSQPGKIYVILDCSAGFEDRFIIQEPISGPDFTNQVVGVLTRF